MNICVYDLATNYEVRVVDSYTKSTLLTYRMPPALIREDSSHKNSRCSLFRPDNPDFSAFIKMNEGDFLHYSYVNDNLLTLPEIMYSLCWETDKYVELSEYYFTATKNLVVGFFKKEEINIDQTVLLVPDALPLESQQKLLSFFGRYKTQLLWHSIAVFLGKEDILVSCKDNSKGTIVDEFSTIGFFVSKIEIKIENGRAIPCHKIYKRADGSKSNWCITDSKNEMHNVLETKIKSDRLTASYWLNRYKEGVTIDKASNLPVRKGVLPYFRYAKLTIHNSDFVISSSKTTVKGDLPEGLNIQCDIGEAGFAGAIKFFEYLSNGQIPYYDECESFSVICQNKKEEFEYFELIKANPYLPGGRKTEGIRIENLCIPKGNKKAEFNFHLGDINNNDAQLRHYSQEFPIEKPLEEARSLLLSPSVIPGQGYAEILIEDNNPDKLFPPIELDWDHMDLALEKGKNGENVKVTKAYLEKNFERSFPPDVPPVISKFATSGIEGNILSQELHALVNLDLRYGMFYNQSSWPYINDNNRGVERFIRQNVFGAYSEAKGHRYSFPKISGVSQQDYIVAFNRIAKIYNADTVSPTKKIGENFIGTDDQIVSFLAWSYLRFDLDGKLLPQLTRATNKVIRYLENRDDYACPAAYASYLANMIVLPEEFERVFKLFHDALKYKNGGVSNWCRAMYQIVMYTSFIYYESDLISRYIVLCMRELSKRLINEIDNRRWKAVDNILRVILYLLKRRVADKSFCKKDNPDALYIAVMDALNYAKTEIRGNRFLRNTIDAIIKYMDGAGTLAGIPNPIIGPAGPVPPPAPNKVANANHAVQPAIQTPKGN